MHKEVLDLLIRLFQDPYPQLDVLLQVITGNDRQHQ